LKFLQQGWHKAGTSTADLKFLIGREEFDQELQIEQRRQICRLCSALCFPKFAQKLPQRIANFGKRALGRLLDLAMMRSSGRVGRRSFAGQ
jgi:hypothetical protein